MRLRWDWSQEEMANTLQVDQASISFWERNKIRPSGSAMVALAALFRTSLAALETGENFVVPDPPSRVPDASRKAKREIPRSVSLHRDFNDPVVLVDLKDGSARGSSPSEALLTLAQMVKEGRRAWVVLE
ncbi:MAG: helix-turn-helix domain-containing protein [Firmicutes bacterium]|nr:helix-turn-helix domain-containing protein [Bacillota bacterium]